MAVPTNTHKTYEQIGVREDLSDLIFDVSPTATPCLSAFGKTKATQTLHEWQTDALAAAAVNAHLEGDDAAANAAIPTVREKNGTQILKKVRFVSGTSQAVDAAGRQNEMNLQVTKGMKEIKRDLEKALTGQQGRVVGAAGTAREMRGIENWIVTNVVSGAGYVTGSDIVAVTDGTQVAFDENKLKSVWKSVYTNGGDPDMLSVGPFNRQVASSFTGGATKFDKTEDKKLIATVDLYVGDFGSVKIVTNLFQRDRTALLLQTDMWKVATLRGLTRTPLAKTGDSEKVELVWECTLEARNQKASGKIADILTA